MDGTDLKRQHRSLRFLALCREAWDVMRKPYKTLDKKEDRRKCFQKGLLHVAEERVLCRQLGSCGFLSGNHIYIVSLVVRLVI